MEAVDTYHRIYAGLLDRLYVGNKVSTALFYQSDIFLSIGIIQRFARDHFWSTAVHLESPYGSHDNGTIGD